MGVGRKDVGLNKGAVWVDKYVVKDKKIIHGGIRHDSKDIALNMLFLREYNDQSEHYLKLVLAAIRNKGRFAISEQIKDKVYAAWMTDISFVSVADTLINEGLTYELKKR